MNPSLLNPSFLHCPTPPDWSLNWEQITQDFEWIQALKECPQDPIYHAEGDVFTHTRMVCEALIQSPHWRQLPATERAILFAAALLHDVAKPAYTKLEENGRISSKGHVRQGAKLARQILWQLDSAPAFFYREQIVGLVQMGSLPIWFLDKQNPQQAVIKASQRVRCDLLAILAEADVRGRWCHDQQELLDKIELFREFCRENHCFDQPRLFPSDHSRFLYFRKDNSNPDYQAFDDTRSQVILMSGLPASGKDFWIQENLENWPVISLDAFRLALNVSPEENQTPVVEAAKTQAKDYLRAGKSFVWNATNTTRAMRQQLIDLFAAYQARIRIVYLEVPFDELQQRNRSRKVPVPEAVIRKLAFRLDIPDLTEAHQVDWIVRESSTLKERA